MSEETHEMIKHEILSGGGFPGRGQQGKVTQQDCSATRLTVSRFYGDGIRFWVVLLVSGLSLATHLDSEFFLVAHTFLSQDGWQREGFWEVVRHMVSFGSFPNSSDWWWLISSVFFTRTSCRKITHTGGAWPGWAVPVNVLPNTKGGVWSRGLTEKMTSVF